jgi:hypothetical protein
MFENRVLRVMFGPNEEEVTGGWRRLRALVNTVMKFLA